MSESSTTGENEQRDPAEAGAAAMAPVDAAPGETWVPAPVPAPSCDVPQTGAVLAALHARLDRLDNSLEAAVQQFSMLPAQIRAMGAKLDAAATSMAEPRYRDILMGLLAVYDLIDQILRGLPAEESDGGAVHRKNYENLLVHLQQILEMNGLSEISAHGAFDSARHRAVHKVATADPASDGHVLEVVRRGFRTPRAVLRYAEVVVGCYEPPRTSSAEAR
jgi:molecular chaperone GrpE (heat shock protein)